MAMHDDIASLFLISQKVTLDPCGLFVMEDQRTLRENGWHITMARLSYMVMAGLTPGLLKNSDESAPLKSRKKMTKVFTNNCFFVSGRNDMQ